MKQIMVLLLFVVIGTLLADYYLSYSYITYYLGRVGIMAGVIIWLVAMSYLTAMRLTNFKSRFGPMTIWWGPNQSVRVYNCVVDSKQIEKRKVKKNPDGEDQYIYLYTMLFDKYIEDRGRGIFRFRQCKVLQPCSYDQAYEEEANTAFEYDAVPCRIKSCAPVFHLLRPSGHRGDPIPLLLYTDGPYYVSKTQERVKLLQPTVEDIEEAERAYDRSLAIPIAIELAGTRQERDDLLRLEKDREKRVWRRIGSLQRHSGDVESIGLPLRERLRGRWWLLILGVIAVFLLAMYFYPQYFPWFHGATQTTITTTATEAATTTAATETVVTIP